MENILINQGSFVVPATVVQQSIQVRSGFDWVKVWLYPVGSSSATANCGDVFYWQKGMPNGSAIVQYHNTTAALNTTLFTTGGIYFADSSITTPEAPKAGTNITRATPARCTTTPVHGYSTGDIVRIYSTTGGMQQIQGLDFTITNIGANTFDLTNLDTIAAGGNPWAANFVAATAYTVRRIPYNPIYYPRSRVITNLQASTVDTTQTIITLSVTHGYNIGDVVDVTVPAVWGVTLNHVQGTVTAIAEAAPTTGFTNTIRVTINPSVWSSGSFVWPAATSLPISYGIVTPVGVASDMSILDAAGLPINPYSTLAATRNDAALYMVLGTGDGTISGPAGCTATDVMYWLAGKNYLI